MAVQNPLDNRPTKNWAVAPIVSAGAKVAYNAFLLVNRDTCRGHQLHFVGIGVSASLGGSGGAPSYTSFTTPSPVNFGAFSGVGARVSSINLGIVWGYSITVLTLWQGPAYLSKLLAQVTMKGDGPMLPGGQAGVHGVTKVTYGSGSVSGNPKCSIPSKNPKDLFERDRIFVKYKIIPKQDRLVIPGPVLFDFDRHEINSRGEKVLSVIAAALNTRSKLSVEIHGHADGKGGDRYNETLGMQRANAVKAWLKKKQVHGAAQFVTKSFGERVPVAPNKSPDGSDNPTGRAKNRRVEIVFK